MKSQSTRYKEQLQRARPDNFVALVVVFQVLLVISFFVFPLLSVLVLVFGAIFMVAYGIETYLISPNRIVRSELIDQELEWLLGKDKVKSVTPIQFVFAQEQIRRRRAARFRFILLSIPFWAVLVLLINSFTMFQSNREIVAAAVILGASLLLLLLIVGLFVRAFPTRWMLARREPRELANLSEEIYTQYGSQMKPNTWYKLSYDGELIEVPESEALQGNSTVFRVGKDNPSNETGALD